MQPHNLTSVSSSVSSIDLTAKCSFIDWVVRIYVVFQQVNVMHLSHMTFKIVAIFSVHTWIRNDEII